MDNTIAELEEEKGNLQLRLVDYEELSASETSTKQEVKELNDRISLQDGMLDSHMSAITQLESEKLDLAEVVKDREADLASVNDQLAEMISRSEEMQRDKVKSELRCV